MPPFDIDIFTSEYILYGHIKPPLWGCTSICISFSLYATDGEKRKIYWGGGVKTF
jgi:hypothetical protein